MSTFDAAMRLAADAVRRGAYHTALRHFEDALSENPESAQAHAELSICLFQMNRRIGALIEAERAVALDPDLPLAHVALGYAALATGDVKGARAAVKRVQALEPESVVALGLRCDIALATRERGELRLAALELLSHEPEDVYATCMLARAAAMGGKSAEAEVLAREALGHEPDNPLAHEAIGWAFFARKRFREAREAGLSALSLQPDRESALLLVAASALRQRWLTGWFFWFALWTMQNSERTYMTMVIILAGVIMLSGNFLWHYGYRDWFQALDLGTWVLGFGMLGSVLILNRILAHETRNVRLVRDY
jgi:Flp pilus assembly protein TadD